MLLVRHLPMAASGTLESVEHCPNDLRREVTSDIFDNQFESIELIELKLINDFHSEYPVKVPIVESPVTVQIEWGIGQTDGADDRARGKEGSGKFSANEVSIGVLIQHLYRQSPRGFAQTCTLSMYYKSQ